MKVACLVAIVVGALGFEVVFGANDSDGDGLADESDTEKYVANIPAIEFAVGHTTASITLNITREVSNEKSDKSTELLKETLTYKDNLTVNRTRSGSRSTTSSIKSSMKWGDWPEMTMSSSRGRSSENSYQQSLSFSLEATEASEKTRERISKIASTEKVVIGEAAGLIRSQLDVANFSERSVVLSNIDVAVLVRDPSGAESVLARKVLADAVTVSKAPSFSQTAVHTVHIPIEFDSLNTARVMEYLGSSAKLKLHINSLMVAPIDAPSATKPLGDIMSDVSRKTALLVLRLPNERERRIYVSPEIAGAATPSLANIMTALDFRAVVSSSGEKEELTSLNGVDNTLTRVPRQEEVTKENIDLGRWLLNSESQSNFGIGSIVSAGEVITIAFVTLREALEGTRVSTAFVGEATSTWRYMSEPPIETTADRLYGLPAPFITSTKDELRVKQNARFLDPTTPSIDAEALFEAGALGSAANVVCHASESKNRPLVKSRDVIELQYFAHENMDALATIKAEDLPVHHPNPSKRHPVTANWHGHWTMYWRGSTQIDVDRTWKSSAGAFQSLGGIVLLLGDSGTLPLTDLAQSGHLTAGELVGGRISVAIYIDPSMLPSGIGEAPVCIGFRPRTTVNPIGRELKRGPSRFGPTAAQWVIPFEKFWLAQPPGTYPKSVSWRKTTVLRQLKVIVDRDAVPAGL